MISLKIRYRCSAYPVWIWYSFKMLKLGNDLKVERVEVKDVRVPEQLIQATSFLHLFFLNYWRSIWRSDKPNRLWLRRHRLISFLSIITKNSACCTVHPRLSEIDSRPRETLADEWSPLRESTGLAGRWGTLPRWPGWRWTETLPKAQRTLGLSSSCQSHIASSNTDLDRISSSESWLSIN